jgi:hypothetical protein
MSESVKARTFTVVEIAWSIVVSGAMLVGVFVYARLAATASLETTSLEATEPFVKSDPALAWTSDEPTAPPVLVDVPPVKVAAKPPMPHFADFRVRVSRAHQPLRLGQRSELWIYRTHVRRAHAGSVNFGSSGVIAMWGCGMDCRGWVMVDRATGKAQWLPRVGEDYPQVDYWGDSGSNLLLGLWADGFEENADCVFEAFVWTGSRFREVKGYPVRVSGQCPDVTVFEGS